MWYYVANGQQQGPFDGPQWEGLITAGTLTPATLVWKEGQANWMPLSETLSPGRETCQICHKAVGADNLIDLNGVRVCAACKPVALQTMREGVTLGADGLWFEGKKMVTRDGSHFPSRCVKCNAPAAGAALTRKLIWNHPLLLLLILTPYLGIIAYIIVAVITRRRAVIHFHICPEHQQRRFYALLGTWLAIPFGFVLTVVAGAENMLWLILVGAVMVFGGLVTGMIWGRYTRTSRIDKNKTIWLRGAGKEFLASLPPWPGI